MEYGDGKTRMNKWNEKRLLIDTVGIKSANLKDKFLFSNFGKEKATNKHMLLRIIREIFIIHLYTLSYKTLAIDILLRQTRGNWSLLQ